MNTLLLRLTGPMQSWGTQSRFSHRDTGLDPSKSGVIGLLCAALGRGRDEPVDDLARLEMGTRVDHEGALLRDYQTAGGRHRQGDHYGVAKADGGPRGTVLSHRFYLADADFLVGLAGEDDALPLLRDIARALAAPRWPPFLGRKAFVPGVPIGVANGLREGEELESALKLIPWPRPDLLVLPPERRPTHLRAVLPAATGLGAEVRHDQPHGAAFSHRRFLPRHVYTTFWRPGIDVPIREA